MSSLNTFGAILTHAIDLENSLNTYYTGIGDADRAKAFYSSVFGWGMTQLGEEMGNYVLVQTTDTDEDQMVQTPGTINGGLAPRSDAQSYPSVVINVPDIDYTVEEGFAAEV